MSDILILSPDPERRRALLLAFELAGKTAESAIDSADAARQKLSAQTVVVDLVTNDEENWRDAQAARRLCTRTAGELVIVLPRGENANSKRAKAAEADRLVRRPFDLAALTREIAEEQSSKRQAPNPKKQ